MAISVTNPVQVSYAGPSFGTTAPVTTVAGSCLIVMANCQNDGTATFAATPITDSKGNTYTAVGPVLVLNGTDVQMRAWYCANALGGAGHTFTANFTGGAYGVMFAHEVRGAATSSPIDAGSYASASTTSGPPFLVTSGTLAQANNAVFSMISANGGGVNPFTNADSFTFMAEQDGNTYWPGAGGYKLVTATTAVACSWGDSGTSGGARFIFAVKEASGGGGVTGTAAWTEASDTNAATGTVTASGTAAWTETNDAAALTGTAQVSASAGWTEANDSAALTGAATVSGVAGWTEASDAAAATGAATASATAAWTESNDSASLSGIVGIAVSGALSWTEANDAAALTGTATTSGVLAWTEPDDATALTGSLLGSGSVAWAEESDIAAISGFVGSVTGAIVWTEADDICDLTGRVGIGGVGSYDKRKKEKRFIEQAVAAANASVLAELADVQTVVEVLDEHDDDEEVLMLLL